MDFRHSSTRGLKRVSILADQLRGAIELQVSEGTRFIIRVAGGEAA